MEVLLCKTCQRLKPAVRKDTLICPLCIHLTTTTTTHTNNSNNKYKGHHSNSSNSNGGNKSVIKNKNERDDFG